MALGGWAVRWRDYTHKLLLLAMLALTVRAVPGPEERVRQARGHFNECGFCMSCDTTQPASPPPPVPLSDAKRVAALPTCDVCTGCTALLRNFSWFNEILGKQYKRPAGATKPGVYFVDEPGSQEGSRPVIKLLHLRGPAKKHDWYDWAWDAVKREPINPTVLTRSELNIATWIQLLLEDCPVFSQVVTTPRVMPLRTTVPGLGWKLDVPRAVTNTFAPGVSLDNIVFRMAPHDMANLLDALNSTRVQIAAVFDLLVAQGDRHGENLHMQGDGNFMLIDNFDKTFLYPNSLMLTRNFVHERIYMGNGGLWHPVTGKPRPPDDARSRSAWPMLAFDHRCHVPDEGLKTDFIPAIRQCFDTLLGYRMPELQARYQMPRSVLKPFLRRAWLMRTRGFEKTLELAYLNKPYRTDRDAKTLNTQHLFETEVKLFEAQTFPLRPKCCRLQLGPPERECDPPIELDK